MSFTKHASALALATALLSGCGPAVTGTDDSQKELKGGGWTDPNSTEDFGGRIAGTTVTGLYHSTYPRTGDGVTSPTGWWMRSNSVEQFAPVLQMTYNGEAVTTLSTTQGFLQVSTGGSLQTVQGAAFTLAFAVGEPLNAQLRVVSATVVGSYARYVTEWLANGDKSWSTFCPHFDWPMDGTAAPTEYMIPVGGAKWLLNGSRVDDPAAIQLSCTHDSVGGCVNWGLPPWEAVTGMFGTPPKLTTVSLKDSHQACTRMKRNDVCGMGDTVTTGGEDNTYLHTYIQHWDSLGIRTMAPQTNATMEAYWGVSGATCYNPSEFRSDLQGPMARLQIQLALCPKPACSSGGNTGLVASARPCLAIDQATGNCSAN